MIDDELKTIDDAINEATLDMKNNKEVKGKINAKTTRPDF